MKKTYVRLWKWKQNYIDLVVKTLPGVCWLSLSSGPQPSWDFHAPWAGQSPPRVQMQFFSSWGPVTQPPCKSFFLSFNHCVISHLQSTDSITCQKQHHSWSDEWTVSDSTQLQKKQNHLNQFYKLKFLMMLDTVIFLETGARCCRNAYSSCQAALIVWAKCINGPSDIIMTTSFRCIFPLLRRSRATFSLQSFWHLGTSNRWLYAEFETKQCLVLCPDVAVM